MKITVLGETIAVTTSLPQEDVLKIAKEVNLRLQEVRDSQPSLSREHLMLLTCLSMGHEILDLTRKFQGERDFIDDRLRQMAMGLERLIQDEGA